eukprot:scaffold15324_cov112-Isochrysis_galbana.AAC.7
MAPLWVGRSRVPVPVPVLGRALCSDSDSDLVCGLDPVASGNPVAPGNRPRMLFFRFNDSFKPGLGDVCIP